MENGDLEGITLAGEDSDWEEEFIRTDQNPMPALDGWVIGRWLFDNHEKAWLDSVLNVLREKRKGLKMK